MGKKNTKTAGKKSKDKEFEEREIDDLETESAQHVHPSELKKELEEEDGA